MTTPADEQAVHVPCGPPTDRPAASGCAPARAPLSVTWRSSAAWITLIGVTVAALVTDLGTKWLAFRYVASVPVMVDRQQVMRINTVDPRGITDLVPGHRPVQVIPALPWLLELTLVLNPGAVFGVGPGQRWFFIGFTGIALGFGLWMFANWTGPRDRIAHVAIGLLLGGGLGNLYDRLVFGCVRDFLHPLPGVRFPWGWNPLHSGGEVWPYVSNVADLLLLLGIAVLLVYLWRRDRAMRRHAGAPAAAAAA